MRADDCSIIIINSKTKLGTPFLSPVQIAITAAMFDAIMNQIPAFLLFFPFAWQWRQISQPISSLLSWMIF
jgi:hypothetical protein